ncbi:MAG TPA: thiamine phosphate synthase [Candidatus Acidoferrum sp.]
MIDRKNPILCYVTDRRSLSVASAPPVSISSGRGVSRADFSVESTRLVEKIAAIAAAGVDWVQIREKDLAARELATLTQGAIARRSKARIIVNDRLDVALAEGAGGVHLGEAGLPVADVARFVKQTACDANGDFLIGASCHSPDGAKAAVRDGAGYIFFGPVFATPSKAKFGEPQGLKKLATVCDAVSVPVIAIGRITLENAGECISSGAAGIAAIRLFQDVTDAAQIVSTLKKLRP